MFAGVLAVFLIYQNSAEQETLCETLLTMLNVFSTL